MKAFIIPEDAISSDLLCYLYPFRFENQVDKNAAILLHKICCASLTHLEKKEKINDVNLSEDEKEVYQKQPTSWLI